LDANLYNEIKNNEEEKEEIMVNPVDENDIDA
jgi:hypothetical protein